MISARYTIKGDLGLAPLRKRIVDRKGLLAVAGRSGRNVLMKHLRAYDRSHPNRMGGARTNFYAKAADSVNFTVVSDNQVAVSINAIGIALQYYGTDGLPGGALRPVTAQYLTIPATPEAHGKRAGEFSDLEVGWAYDPERNCMRLALVRRQATLLKFRRRTSGGVSLRVALPGGEQGGEPVFWLVRSVRFAGSPDLLPDEETLADAVYAKIEDYLHILDERSAA